MRKYRWIWFFFIIILFPIITLASDGKYEKDGELYYQFFRNNERTGYSHAVFYKVTQDNINWVRIEQNKKEKIRGWLSSKTSRDHSVIMLKNNRFYSIKSKGEKNGEPYEVEIQTEKDGLRMVVMEGKKLKEGFFPHSDYDYTSIDSPSLYLKLYNTPYTLNIFDLNEGAILRSQITLKRKEKMEDSQFPFDSWVIRVENAKSKKTDWMTPGGILIQSVGNDRDGNFVIRVSSKEKAFMPEL